MPANSQSSKSASKPKWAIFGWMLGFCCLLLTIAVHAVRLPVQATPPSSPDDVIVAEVTPGSIAAKAGLLAGDILLSYAGRPLASPFAFLAAVENSPAAKVTVKVRRGSQIIELTMPSLMSEQTEPTLQLSVIVRPILSSEILSPFLAGQAEFDAKHWEAARAKWHSALQVSEAVGDKRVSGWLCGMLETCEAKMVPDFDLLRNPIEKLAWLQHKTEMQKWTQRTWEYVKDGNDRAAQFEVLWGLGTINLNLGSIFRNSGKIEAASSWFYQAYSIAVQDGNEIWAAEARDWQGLSLLGRYTLSTLNSNDAATKEKDLVQARLYCNEALEIRKRLLPASLALANSFEHIGMVASCQLEWAEGQTYYEQALDLYRQVAAKRVDMTRILSLSGEVATVRGDAASAQRYYREVLPLYQGADANSQEMRSTILYELAALFAMQGDLEQAKQSLRQSRDTYPKTASDYPAHEARCLMTLGIIAAAQNDLPQAKRDCEQALILWQDGTSLSQEGKASVLNTLGQIATAENQFSQAQRYYQEALKIWQAVRPNSTGMAGSLAGLGMVAMAGRHLADAQTKFEQAQKILRATTTGASQDASFLANMGRLHLLQKQPEKALPLLKEATGILEKRRQRILDLDSRALFMQVYANPFADLIQAYIALHQPDKAFATLERLHARSFADNLAEWRLPLDQNLPQNLKDRQQNLANARRISEKDLERASEKNNADAKAKAQSSIDSLTAQQRQLAADIRQDYIRRSGHDIEYPLPIDLKAAQRSLPQGVLALAYAVDDDRAYLFALTKSSCHVYALPLSRKLLTDRVKTARELITNINSNPQMYGSVLKDLYHDLLAPAQAEITKAHSLLICPDSALNLLPFAALMPKPRHFLIQDKPVTMVASLTVYHSLRSQKRSPTTSLLALGDPAYDIDNARPMPNRVAGISPKTVETKTIGTKWKRLPETGKLAQEIKVEYAPHSLALLKEQATAANFLARSGQASIVHVGCHGVADDRNPFSSSLVLTPDAKDDDGRLFAWQILHRRLNARLVVLWGCETGLGAENRYEGVLGLPYAFQTAGAENVLTTLWEVKPKETSPLLHDFYHICKESAKDKPLAETLREAQIKAITADPRPYCWAAFVLDGVGE